MRKPKLKYISTRLVTKKSKSAFQEGAKKAMDTHGYVVIAHEGWVIRKSFDGTVERLEKLDNETENLKLTLD